MSNKAYLNGINPEKETLWKSGNYEAVKVKKRSSRLFAYRFNFNNLFLQGNGDLTDKPNRNRIEFESGKESKGDIKISVAVIGNVCYGDWGSKWNSIA